MEGSSASERSEARSKLVEFVQKIFLQKPVKLHLEERDGARIASQRGAALQFPFRQTVPRHERQPGLVQTVDPTLEVLDGNPQSRTSFRHRRLRQLQVGLHHIKRGLEQFPEFRFDKTFPLLIKLRHRATTG